MKHLLSALLLTTAGALSASAQYYQRDLPHPMHDGYSTKYGYANSRGYMVIKPKYDEARMFREGFAAVMKDGKWGFIEPSGRMLTKLKYDYVEDFYRTYAVVCIANRWGAIDTSGKVVVPVKFATKEDLADLLVISVPVPFEKDGKWGFRGKENITIIAPYYEAARPFTGTRAAVKRRGLWGFIDMTGKAVIPTVYQEVGDFRDGKAAVKTKGRWGLIDTQGNELVPARFETVEELEATLSNLDNN